MLVFKLLRLSFCSLSIGAGISKPLRLVLCCTGRYLIIDHLYCWCCDPLVFLKSLPWRSFSNYTLFGYLPLGHSNWYIHLDWSLHSLYWSRDVQSSWLVHCTMGGYIITDHLQSLELFSFLFLGVSSLETFSNKLCRLSQHWGTPNLMSKCLNCPSTPFTSLEAGTHFYSFWRQDPLHLSRSKAFAGYL